MTRIWVKPIPLACNKREVLVERLCVLVADGVLIVTGVHRDGLHVREHIAVDFGRSHPIGRPAT